MNNTSNPVPNEESTPAPDANTATKVGESGQHPLESTSLPLAFYVCFTMFLALALFPVMENSVTRDSQGLQVMFGGAAIGFTGFLILVAGLAFRRWVRGFLVANVLASVAYLLVLLGMMTNEFMRPQISQALWGLALVPVFLLASSAPFAVARFFGGFHLTQETRDLPSVRYGIQDFFVITAIVGSMLFLPRVAQAGWQAPQEMYWWSVGSSFAMAAALSLFLVMPASLLALAVRDISWTFFATACFTILLCVAMCVFLIVVQAPSIDGYPFLMVITACISFFGGTSSMRAAGFRLAHNRRTALAESNPAVDRSPASNEEPEDQPVENPWSENAKLTEDAKENVAFWDSRAGTRWCAGLILAFAVVGSISMLVNETIQMQQLAEKNDRARPIWLAGGEIEVYENRISRMKLGPRTDDEALLEILAWADVQELDLSHTQITDAAIQPLLNSAIGTLDISYTAISSEGVKRLLPRVPKLTFAGLNVDGKDATTSMLVTNQGFFSEADWSDLPIDFDELKKLWEVSQAYSIAVRGMDLTDNQLLELLKIHSPTDLDVRDNNLTGEFLLGLGSNGDALKLQGNPITDQALAEAVKSGITIDELELGDNALTDASLPDLERLGLDALTLDGESYSEKALSKSMLSVDRLAIHGDFYTGACFKDWTPGCYDLDLSDSSILNEHLPYVAGWGLSTLDLSGTKLDDSGLKKMANKGWIYQLKIGRTAVTANGLCNADFSGGVTTIIADWGQFSSAEIKQIRRHRRLELAGGQ